MVARGLPDFGLVYGWSGAVHVVQGELDVVPPLVQASTSILAEYTSWRPL